MSLHAIGATLFASGRAADIVLGVFVVEAIYLIAVRHRPAADVLLALAPGVFFVLALRAALTHEKWEWVAIFVAASLPFHLSDLRRRKLL